MDQMHLKKQQNNWIKLRRLMMKLRKLCVTWKKSKKRTKKNLPRPNTNHMHQISMMKKQIKTLSKMLSNTISWNSRCFSTMFPRSLTNLHLTNCNHFCTICKKALTSGKDFIRKRKSRAQKQFTKDVSQPWILCTGWSRIKVKDNKSATTSSN